MRAAIADLTSLKKRGTGYGIFNTAYGLCMFIGAASMGWLYEIDLRYIMVFSLLNELIALVLFVYIVKSIRSKKQ
jgi:MFS family permease